MSTTTGTLYLVPNTLGDSPVSQVLPTYITTVINQVEDYIVENEKSARHFLKKAGLAKPMQGMRLYVLDEHTSPKEALEYLKPLKEGRDMGIVSEAGCPAVADPGATIVALAHDMGIKVVPLVGPSSILLALMASGFNGQSFTFVGYLPRERSERGKRLLELEKESQQRNQTQLFIETPYRNIPMFEDLLKHLDSRTKLCVACDITLETEFIATKTILEWRKHSKIGAELHKRPAIFLIYAGK